MLFCIFKNEIHQRKQQKPTPAFFSSIDDAISQDNEISLIDLLVDSLKLPDFGFAFDFVENGRPAYHLSDLLKLFIYGYLNRMRSSRTLEKNCRRNIELMWLLKGLVPDQNTIANFRKDNSKAIASVFRATVKMASHFELIGGGFVVKEERSIAKKKLVLKYAFQFPINKANELSNCTIHENKKISEIVYENEK